MSTSDTSEKTPQRWGLRSIGPAIIVASVTVGPGSVLSASRNGYDFGYQTVWVLLAAGVLMFAMTALSGRLGVGLKGTVCDELAAGLGRPAAALVGTSLFLVAACFQFGNNLGVVAALEPFYNHNSNWGKFLPMAVIANMNVLVITALFGFRALYRPVEKLMKVLIGLMVIGFAANVFFAKPDLAAAAAGLVPQLPVPRNADTPAGLAQRFQPMIAMFATTFVIGGALYQSYLVRQKGWTVDDTRKGMIDSAVGISVVVLITGMILATAASMLSVQSGLKFETVADVAQQLKPAFGEKATVLFSLGIFAAAFSSFLVNAMIGGTVMADGLGLGGSIDNLAPKLFTVLGLAIGMNVALYIVATGQRPVQWIIAAQAFTVLAGPVLAGALVYLSFRPMVVPGLIPWWMRILAICALAMQIVLAAQTGYSVYNAYRQLETSKPAPAAPAAPADQQDAPGQK